MLCYHLAKVIETKKGRVYVEQGDPWGGERWYMKSGKSCNHPTGQSNLVVPTPEVLKWIEDHPCGDTKFETDYIYTPPGQREGDRCFSSKALSASRNGFADAPTRPGCTFMSPAIETLTLPNFPAAS